MWRDAAHDRAPLTFSLTDASVDGIKSIQSQVAALFLLARAEKDETSQQLSQDGDLDLSVAATAELILPGLGEGVRTGLRRGSWGRSPEPTSVPRAGSQVGQSSAGPCWPRLSKQLELGSSHHAPGAVLSHTGLGAALAPGREGSGERRPWDQDPRFRAEPC